MPCGRTFVLSLRELQRGVMRHLLDDALDRAAACPGDAPALGIVPPSGIAPAQALRVYANNARTNFIDSMKSSFPATLRLVGEDYFRQCARSFHARHPSLSGDLQPAGTGFAAHLSELHAAGDYRYLGEVARLEWLIQEALLAADHGPLDLEALGRVPPAGYEDLKFALHPTVRLFAACFPCLEIWQANVGSDAEPGRIDLDGGGDRLLLMRDRGRLQFHPLSPGELGFLQALEAGEHFSAALDAGARGGVPADESCADAAVSDAATVFDAAAALQRFVIAGVIVDFH